MDWNNKTSQSLDIFVGKPHALHGTLSTRKKLCRVSESIPVSSHRAQPPSPLVLAHRPQVLKGQSPWSKPLTVQDVLGNWTYGYPTIRRGPLASSCAAWSVKRLFSTMTIIPQCPQ
ncbi:hypothetical protein PoB_001032200 [Plakobranchus ocellatus]|uniref:Uncharacterized protein n=1 Tax=Plakobranchus ocellatus TaxID=259542 RepID=A0AAV3YN22_9GAST|nr:hypothetical protein PoB_001032200 [Plakobranchus ocellatus]